MSPYLKYDRRRFLSVAGVAAAGLCTTGLMRQFSPPAVPVEDALPDLTNATAWLNSEPLTASRLRGKIVVIYFWTYTCIYWLRSLPYVRAWSEKYRAEGLVVIGVHTPEFSFERNVDNVRQAAKQLQVDYPIAIDNDYAIWHDFQNRYWPALYFVDRRGRIRHYQFGEGEYQRSEMIIQQLLAEAEGGDIAQHYVSVSGTGVEAAADWASLMSPETYLGHQRSKTFASPGGSILNKNQVYTPHSKLELNHWALSGNWKIRQEAIFLNEENGRIRYRFHARDLHLVMGPKMQRRSVPFRVSLDGDSPGTSHGIDVDELGNGIVTGHRLYQLIRQRTPVTTREFEIEFFDRGIEVFAFTFG